MLSKENKTVKTEARIKRLKTIYDILRSFNAAAEFVYFDEVAKRDRYRTPSGSKTAEDETLIIDEAAWSNLESTGALKAKKRKLRQLCWGFFFGTIQDVVE